MQTEQRDPATHNPIKYSPVLIAQNDADIATGEVDMADLAGISGLTGTPDHLENPSGTGVFTFEEYAPIGTVTFRPIDGKFFGDKEVTEKMEPYCKIKLGWHSGKIDYVKGEGLHANWSSAIVLDRKHDEKYAKLKIKDKKRTVLNDTIGVAKIDLDDVELNGKVSKWYPLEKGGKTVGEVLVDVSYQTNKTE